MRYLFLFLITIFITGCGDYPEAEVQKICDSFSSVLSDIEAGKIRGPKLVVNRVESIEVKHPSAWDTVKSLFSWAGDYLKWKIGSRPSELKFTKLKTEKFNDEFTQSGLFLWEMSYRVKHFGLAHVLKNHSFRSVDKELGKFLKELEGGFKNETLKCDDIYEFSQKKMNDEK